MKKQIAAAIIALLLVFILTVPVSANPNHNGTPFDYYTAHDTKFTAYSIGGELSYNEYVSCLLVKTYFENISATTVMVADPTAKYNCHSFAWHSQSSNNNTWINMGVTNFFEDTVASVTSELPWNTNTPSGTVSVGDIIVYKFSNGTLNHSAIVYYTDGTLNNTLLISKWGDGCVMIHSVYSGHPYCDSASVKVFRPISSHVLSYSDLNNKKHRLDCSCGYYTITGHISVVSGNAYVCTRCGHSVDIMVHDPEEY